MSSGKSLINILFSLIMLPLFTGCEHRPLEDAYRRENTFVRVYFDEHIRNVSYGFYDETKKKPEYHSPKVLRVMFYDETDGKVVTERYLYDSGKDERGYYIQGTLNVPNGRYNMLAYNFDTEDTRTRDEDDYEDITAYTRQLNESEEDRLFSRGDGSRNGTVIRREPDHLFVTTVEGIDIDSKTRLSHVDNPEHPDTIRSSSGQHPVAETIVKTYYLQFNVKGVEYVRSAVALISGMAGAKTMHNGEMVDSEESSIFFSLNNGKEKNRSKEEVAVAYASFNTFGKLPHTEGYIDITFEFNTIYNTVQTETLRVTDMFETDMVKENQWIIIDKLIEIIPPDDVETGGGMAPGVNDWEQIEGSITI